MPVACDQLVGSEIVQELSSSARYCVASARSGRDSSLWRVSSNVTGTSAHCVMHDRPVCHAPLFCPTVWPARSATPGATQVNALLSQVILDRKGDGTLEPGRREDVARVTGVCEPLHDRAQALRHASGWVTDAVVIDEEKPHT